MSENEKIKARIITELNSIKLNLDAKQIKKLQIDRLERIISRLDQYSEGCNECEKHLEFIETDVIDKLKALDKQNINYYNLHINKIIAHLRNKHKLAVEGQYMAMSMSLGMAMGMVLGLTLKNTTFGIGPGLCIGIAIGVAIDADAKKKGKVI